MYAQAARETGALKEAKDKLEKKVEELQIRLQLDKMAKVLFCAIILMTLVKIQCFWIMWIVF